MEDNKGLSSPSQPPWIELVVDVSMIVTPCDQQGIIERLIPSILTRFHAGYFRISLSLCSQALLWKTLGEPSYDTHAIRRFLHVLPFAAFVLLWSLALFILSSLSLIYILRCLFHFEKVKAEFLHDVGVNYLFAPWISWLLLLQSSPFIGPKTILYTTMGGIHCPHSGAGCQDIRPIMVHQGKAVSGDGGESGLPVIGDWEPGRCMGLKYSQSSLKPEFT